MSSHLFHQLRRDPFDGEVDPREPLLSEGARSALAVLEEGLAQGAAILVLTGEPGVGKTTLARVLAARAAPAGVRTVFVHHPEIAFDDLLTLIGAEIGLPDLRRRSTFERLRTIQAALVSALARGGRLLVVIDEAQALPDETLEALRLLVTLEAGPRARPLQILLAGHPELDDRLRRRRWSAVEQRVGARAVLEPMAAREARDWLEARLAQGVPAADDVFTGPALDALARRGRGRPRTLDRLASRALADARDRRERPVRRATVLRAASEIGGSGGRGGAWAGLAAAFGAAVILLAAAASWRAGEGARIDTARRATPRAAASAPPLASEEPLRAAVAISAPEPAAAVAPQSVLRPAIR